ncbi:hypothetical protein ABZ128_13095 [Streptomyces sp. NPDC006326]|uniref:hypothetical protein n=1 Tax=Streptomyces sp. NPDC006326 TaxID=3156752 RepID=UPI0033B5B107
MPVSACLAAVFVLTACAAEESAAGGPGGAAPAAAAAASDPYAGKTPEEIQTLAYEATRTATFKKVRGQMSAEGRTGSLELAFANVDCAGTVSGDGLGKTEVHSTPEVVYVKRDADTWRAVLNGTKAQEDAAVDRFAGRWVKLGAEREDAAAVSYGCSLMNPHVLQQERTPGLTRGAAATVDGQPALTLTYPGESGGTVTEYIAGQGRPYLLRRTETGQEASDLTYFDFETVTQLRAPADSEVVLPEG